MDGITEEHDTIQQQNWPKDIDFKGLKAGANDPHQKHESNSFPYLYLAHGSDEWFLRISDHLVENEGLLIFLKVFFRFLLDKAFGCEIADG